MKPKNLKYITLTQALKNFPEGLHESIVEELSNSDISLHTDVQKTFVTIKVFDDIVDGVISDSDSQDIATALNISIRKGMEKLRKSVPAGTMISV